MCVPLDAIYKRNIGQIEGVTGILQAMETPGRGYIVQTYVLC